jgi:DNA-binding transcriptional regulator YiaG
MSNPLVTVAESSAFQRGASRLLSEEEHDGLITFLAENPTAGAVIAGTGGVRKVRFATGGRGKSGATRVIYYYFDVDVPLYALLIYGKGEQANLTPDQKRAVTALARRREGRRQDEKDEVMNTLGDDLVEAMGEMVAHLRGESTGMLVHHVTVTPEVDVRAIREKTGLSRVKFAERFALDPRALQDWEQGRRRPDRAARAYLTVIARNPEAVTAALLGS